MACEFKHCFSHCNVIDATPLGLGKTCSSGMNHRFWLKELHGVKDSLDNSCSPLFIQEKRLQQMQKNGEE